MMEDSRTEAVLLLTVPLGAADRHGAKPLSAGEWARLAACLRERDTDPSALMTGDLPDLLSGWNDPAITPGRLDRLLGRGPALGLALEKWYRAGLWVLTRSDPAYPERLDRRLGEAAPPVLFGCGSSALLERGGLAVVGSRNASEDDLEFSRCLGEAASRQGLSVVSGGARGIDRNSMQGALDSEGMAVGVLSDNLLRTATSAQYRRPLLSDDLSLISSVNPEARFHVGNAMARNRYIYCLADAAVVVASARGSGGTWNGACENLKAGWVPLWVKETNEPDSGNTELAVRGARRLGDTVGALTALFEGSDALSQPASSGLSDEKSSWSDPAPAATQLPGTEAGLEAIPTGLEFYELFLARLATLTTSATVPESSIATSLEVAKGQVKDWLKRGVAEGRIKRMTAPLRYRSPHPEQRLPLDGPEAGQPSPGGQNTTPPAIPSGLDIYNLFLCRLAVLTSDEAHSSRAIAQILDGAPGQVNKWLKRGVTDGKIQRETEPVRYRYCT